MTIILKLTELGVEENKELVKKQKKTFEELVEEIKPYLLNPDEVNN